ncbi:MAG: protoporphyrinogen oxidase [Anaerolineae bacterium]|nr:protoporphyrinogen oxidase [Anaerolineae bacterium]MDW8099664.1 protoporphyrinogen oxidase [Anaerolineae bacterium]
MNGSASSSQPIPHVIIVGGGIAGLSTAYHLQKRAKAAGHPVSCTLIEQERRLGGKILTERIGGFVIEGGPDSFLTQKPWGVQLARELGLGDQIIGTNEGQRRVFVLHRGRLRPLPDGVMLIVPTKFMPFVLSPLISPLGKLRMGLDLFIPPRRDGQDETLADFIRRRLGEEALDKIAEPLMSGIHNAESDRQSILATFPRFRALEEKYGSLIRGMLAMRRQASAASPNGREAFTGAFASLRGGLGDLVEALVSALDKTSLLTGQRVGEIRYDPDTLSPYQVRLADGKELIGNAVVLATPAYVSADLVASFAPELAAGLRAIRYVSTGTISLAYRRGEIGHPLNGFGFVIPRSERRWINACTWTSTKFSHRAPDDHVLVRVFFGGSRHPEMVEWPDERLLATVQDELRGIMGITARPVLVRIYRWPLANPQYDVGHLDRVARLEALCPSGLYLTGSAYWGLGIPDCIRQGEETAARVLAGFCSK